MLRPVPRDLQWLEMPTGKSTQDGSADENQLRVENQSLIIHSWLGGHVQNRQECSQTNVGALSCDTKVFVKIPNFTTDVCIVESVLTIFTSK